MKWLIDITIGYPQNKPLDMQTIVAGTRKPCQVVLHHRKFPITDLPLETEALTKWMNDRFVEKEKLLEVFYKTGQFPKWNEKDCCVEEDCLLKPTEVCFSAKRVVFANLFYLGVLVLTYQFFVCPIFTWVFAAIWPF